jgi:hypothetical protein
MNAILKNNKTKKRSLKKKNVFFYQPKAKWKKSKKKERAKASFVKSPRNGEFKKKKNDREERQTRSKPCLSLFFYSILSLKGKKLRFFPFALCFTSF